MKTVYDWYSSRLPKKVILDIISRQKVGRLASGISGSVYGDQIQVKYMHGYQSSPTMFRGWVFEEQDRTILTGTFGTPIYPEILLWICVGLVTLVLLLLIYIAVSSPGSIGVFAFSVPLAILLFSYFIFRMNQSIKKKGQEKIRDFIEKRLFAHPMDS